MKPLKRGLANGLKTSRRLLKIMLPFSIGFDLVSKTPLLAMAGRAAAPLMLPFGLPGTAAAAVISGLSVNLYAAIAVIPALGLTNVQVTTLGLMLGFAHTLPVEIAVLRALGTRWRFLFCYRIAMFVVSGLIISLVLGHGGVPAPQQVAASIATPALHESVGAILLGSLWKGLETTFKVTLIVVAILVLFEVLSELRFVRATGEWLAPHLARAGISRGGALALFAGLGLGLAYGAGLILRAKESHEIEEGELFRVALFLCTCHAIVEDTLLFVAVGANGWWIAGIRSTLAIAILAVPAILMPRMSARAVTTPTASATPDPSGR